MRQQAELRVVVHQGHKYGLVWYATLRGYDVYAGTADRDVVFSYHESGIGHVHTFRRRDRIDMPPAMGISKLVGRQKVGGWGVQRAEWGYTVKRDTTYRKTVVLEAPVRNPSTIEFWLLEVKRPELAAVVLAEEYRHVEVITSCHIAATSPQLLAVVWTFPVAVLESALKALIAEKAGQGGLTPGVVA